MFKGFSAFVTLSDLIFDSFLAQQVATSTAKTNQLFIATIYSIRLYLSSIKISSNSIFHSNERQDAIFTALNKNVRSRNPNLWLNHNSHKKWNPRKEERERKREECFVFFFDNMSKLRSIILIIIFIAFDWCLPLACPSDGYKYSHAIGITISSWLSMTRIRSTRYDFLVATFQIRFGAWCEQLLCFFLFFFFISCLASLLNRLNFKLNGSA